MADSRSSKSDDTIIIKKYANRRLYNTRSSSYITLDFLAELVRENVDFKVIDAKTGEDITHNVLTQIIMDEEASGQPMLPVGFLRELISMYGHSMQNMIPQYLEASMLAFRDNQQKFHKAMHGTIMEGPLAQIAKQNFAMVEAATQAFGSRKGTAKKDEAPTTDKATKKDNAKADNKGQQTKQEEIDTLKAEIEAMQQKLDKLGKKS